MFPDLVISDIALNPEKGYQAEFAVLTSPTEKEALSAAISSEVCYQAGRAEEGAFYAMHAVSINPESLDGHIQMVKWGLDVAERRATLRELISVFRPKYLKYILVDDAVRVNPYIRLLYTISISAFREGRTEEAVLATEEILRIRRNRTSVEDLLLMEYLQMIGFQRNSRSGAIERKWDHVDALIRVRNPSNDYWIRILRNYQNHNEEWKNIAKAQLTKKRVQQIYTLITRSGQSVDAFAIMLKGWHDFVLDLMMLFKISVDPSFYVLMNNVIGAVSGAKRTTMAKTAIRKMRDGIAELEKENNLQAIVLLEEALQHYNISNGHSIQMHMNIPPEQIVNMVKAFASVGLSKPMRYIVRIGLTSYPNERVLYEHLHMIGAGYFCNYDWESLSTLSTQALEVIDHGGDCREIAKRVVALLSLKGLISAVMNKLTESVISELESNGIQDYREPICFRTNILEPLEWIAESPTEYDY